LKRLRSGRRRSAASGGCGSYSLLLQGRVEPGERTLEGARLVGDAELEERLPLHDLDRALAVVDAGQLDDDAIVARLLHDGLRDAELVDSGADDLERAIDRIGLIGNRALGLVDFERQVHSALQIEAVLERHPPDRRVVKRPVGPAMAYLDVARENSPDR
jgi:hypothetical protein